MPRRFKWPSSSARAYIAGHDARHINFSLHAPVVFAQPFALNAAAAACSPAGAAYSAVSRECQTPPNGAFSPMRANQRANEWPASTPPLKFRAVTP
ncbi:hypothetical protein BUPH_00828 [Paraburkholderia phenoliruptrix BR3459a]|uniref:Uncharacterized protein n=1 Tax=Paraburkholderia phenoliruptrix BR3459a TaxID=1229205 RepID=K0DWD7_9BURK|nr:hypothetical protein BUPH_00828 [Paraburkholderia phenoliruptrix BR3459a]